MGTSGSSRIHESGVTGSHTVSSYMPVEGMYEGIHGCGKEGKRYTKSIAFGAHFPLATPLRK